MYADNTLTPKEAIRLCALGTLAQAPMRYGALVTAVRHFISRITGPSLELMGESIELLRYEGLISSGDSESEAMSATAALAITQAGQAVLQDLLVANLRPGNSDLNELIAALKFRFLHMLPPAAQDAQMELLIEASETEYARLDELRDRHSGDEGNLGDWLALEISRLDQRLDWLREFRRKLSTGGG